MTEPNTLSLKISELKEWQMIAWRRIADPAVTPFERREIRNHMKESDDELRRCLQTMSDRLLCVPKTKSERIDDEVRPGWRANL
jgi:hypothetical protein